MSEGTRPASAPGNDARDAATRAATADGMPASILDGRYRVERVIGEGAFGRVYLAFDTRLRRNVAIKELLAARNKTDQATYERYLDRFQREARAAGVAQHQNIVTVYELYVDAGENYYLVMEYIDGTSLRDLLEQVGTLPLERAVAVALEVARALEAVHEQDIVHRDLKPANIMLTHRGMAKLADFGIAQVGHESMRTQIVSGHPGTPMYMSPEQAGGYGYIDGRSDLYSLGLVIYEMLAGTPFARKRQPLAAVRPDLSAALVAIVNRLMERDAEARYQSATEVIDDLQRLSVAPSQPVITDAGTASGEGETRIAQPPWIATPPPLGVPSSYGGPASQSQPGAPAPAPAMSFVANPTPIDRPPAGEGETRVATPSAEEGATRVGALSPPPAPIQSGGPPQAPNPPGMYPTAPPPASPPAKSKRGLFVGIGAIAAVLIVGGAIAGLFAGRGGGATATPLIQTATWSDPESRIQLQYPGGWTLSGPNATSPDAAVVLTNPGTLFVVSITDPVGTVDDAIQKVRAERTTPIGSLKPDTCQPTADARIGGQPGRYIECTGANGGNVLGQWFVDNAGKRFRFQGADLGKHRAEIERVINSVTFTTPTAGGSPAVGGTPAASAAAVQTTAWTAPGGQIALKYPANWVAKPSGAGNNLLDISSPVGERFVVDIYDQLGTLAEAIQADRDAHANDATVTYTNGTDTDARVGGEPAKMLPFSYVFKNNPGGPAVPGIGWIVNHSGKTYRLYAQNIRADRTPIDAIIASVTFPPSATPTAIPTSFRVKQDSFNIRPTGSSAPELFMTFERPDSWTSESDTSTTPATERYFGLNGLRFLVTIDAAGKTPDERILELKKQLLAQAGGATLSFSPTADVIIGGERGKYLTYLREGGNQPAERREVWIVDHRDRSITFTALYPPANRDLVGSEIGGTILTVRFAK